MNKSLQLKMIYGLAITLGLALMVGESIRSYGIGRPFIHWFDDFILAIFLFIGVFKTVQSVKNIKYLSAAWSISFVVLYMSYSRKANNPSIDMRSNLSSGVLTNLLLLAVIVSVVGLLWTLLVDFSKVE